MSYAKVYDLKQNLDDRGILYEVIRSDLDFAPELNQVYIVKDRTSGIIRAYHKHEKLWDYFHIATGSAMFIFFKNQIKAASGEQQIQKIILDSRKPQMVVVPPGIWHGWMSLENNTMLVSTASHTYNKENPDEVRRKPDVLGNIWKIEAK